MVIKKWGNKGNFVSPFFYFIMKDIAFSKTYSYCKNIRYFHNNLNEYIGKIRYNSHSIRLTI